jgi:gas vesicle protein GvpN
MQLVGRKTEHDLIRTMIQAERNVLLEGPVGVGKTTLALAIAEELSKNVLRVDGDGRYTEQKLIGSFDPKLVLEQGFSLDSFLPGPLYQAMQSGSILLINELNRMPEMVQNVLLPALDERKIQIPVSGELIAKPGFAVIATQNPREFVATSPLSEALLDRLEWISIPYLSESEEEEVVRLHLTAKSKTLEPWIHLAVSLTRLTRQFPKIKRGSSIRAAISMIQVMESSLKNQKMSEDETETLFWTVAKSVLANRIELQVGKFSNHSYSDLLTEILAELKSALKKKS